MTTLEINNAKEANSLIGSFIHSENVTGKVTGTIIDGGDYGTNYQYILLVENPMGQLFQTGLKASEKLDYNEYLDYIGLRYGVFY